MTLMIRLTVPRSKLTFSKRQEMKKWCKENGGIAKGKSVPTPANPNGHVGYEFSFFDEETAMAFCLSFDVNPNNIKGVKK